MPCGSGSSYCNPDADALVIRARSALDPATRNRAYGQLQEIYARDLPFIRIATPADLRLASAKLVLPERQNDFLVMKAITEWDLKE